VGIVGIPKNAFIDFNLAVLFARIRCRKNNDGPRAHFLFVTLLSMDLLEMLDRTLPGLGYELVDVERSNHGKLLRVFIDKPEGISVDDCVLVSNHLSHLFQVEHIDYERLEVSSPGLDRPLRRVTDFQRFQGEKASVRTNTAHDGQRNFIGILRGVDADTLKLEIDGATVSLDIADIRKARLVPAL
jgi:ribosome maturation factor RimP